MVKQVRSHGAVEIKDPKSKRSWLVNGQRLKHYVGGDFERLISLITLTDKESASSYMTLIKRLLEGNPVFKCF